MQVVRIKSAGIAGGCDMKRTIGIILLALVLILPLAAEKLGTLPDVLKPDNITIEGNELFVVEGARVFIYSLADLTLKTKIGKPGEGPGEIQTIPNFPNRVVALPDRILFEGINKLLFFDRRGKFMREIRKPGPVARFLPVGDHFVAVRITPGDDNQTVFSTVDLYDADIQHLKILYRQPFVQQGTPPNIKLDMTMDFINIQVHDGKIFIEESPAGFVIQVFDENGGKLQTLRRQESPVKLTAKDRQGLENELREDPWVRPQIKGLGGWATAKKLFDLQYPDAFPPIKAMDISEGRLFVKTHRTREGRDEYLLMDLDGSNLKRVFIPRRVEAPMMARIMGVKRYAIRGGKLYYIKENPDDEEWELHVEKILE